MRPRGVNVSFVRFSGGRTQRGSSSISGSPGDMGQFFFLSLPNPPTPQGPSGSPYNPSPSHCFDRLLYRGHTSGGRKCPSGEKSDRLLTRRHLIFSKYHNATQVFDVHQLFKLNSISWTVVIFLRGEFMSSPLFCRCVFSGSNIEMLGGDKARNKNCLKLTNACQWLSWLKWAYTAHLVICTPTCSSEQHNYRVSRGPSGG